MALTAAQVKPGMAIVVAGLMGQWEVLDKHPRPAHYWLHRWNDGVWETTCEHMRDFHKVADGSRHEHIQPELEMTAA